MGEAEERIRAIEEEIRKTPYHKGTEHHIGRLRARIARLRNEIQTQRVSRSGGGGFALRRAGDATVVLIGPPSVGKSTLINRLSGAASKVGDYDFTTTAVVPGMMEYKGAKIQIFDLPGLITGAALGKGRGKEVISVARQADLLLLLVDINSLPAVFQIKEELYQAGIRLDEKKPEILIKRKLEGGIRVINQVSLSQLNSQTVREIAAEFHLTNAEIILREDITLNRLIDAFLGNRVYSPYLLIVNKIDLSSSSFQNNPKTVFISAEKEVGIEELKEKIWQNLGLIRVYLKSQRKGVDLNQPYILKKGQSLKDILEKLSFADINRVNSAKIYGPKAKFAGQKVSLSFTPEDEEVVQYDA